jgi:hypothetical protein
MTAPHNYFFSNISSEKFESSALTCCDSDIVLCPKPNAVKVFMVIKKTKHTNLIFCFFYKFLLS